MLFNRKYKVVLFDFDGVLGRTMKDNYNAWVHVFSEYGMKIEKEEYFLLEGKSPVEVAGCLLQKYNGDLEFAAPIAALKDRFYLKNNSFSLYEGAELLLESLKKQGFLIGLVTGASFKRFYDSVKKSFLSSFDVIVTADDVERGKPDAECYLKAAKKMGVNPCDCVVVENAPLGILSAKKAGMDCIAISSTLAKEYLQEADFIFTSLDYVTTFFNSWAYSRFSGKI